jgi:hypothetical protein
MCWYKYRTNIFANCCESVWNLVCFVTDNNRVGEIHSTVLRKLIWELKCNKWLVDLQNGEIYDLYWKGNLIGSLKWKGLRGPGRVDVWERGETMQKLVWRPEVNSSLGRLCCKCKGKYKIYLQVIVWEINDWIDLA